MVELGEEELEYSIEFLYSRKPHLRDTARDVIVRHIGWNPETPEGRMIGEFCVREARQMRKNKRRTGLSYFQHCVAAGKEVSKIELPKPDTTLAIAAVGHDGPEDWMPYEKQKRLYVVAKEELDALLRNNDGSYASNEKIDQKEAELELIAKEADYAKRSYLSDLRSFLLEKGMELNFEVDVNSVVDIIDALTKRPEEYYHEYLERLFGRNRFEIPNHEPLLNILRMSIIKVRGDRKHNNSTVPRESYPREKGKFTIPQRSKECYKSIQTIHRTNVLMSHFPEAKNLYPYHSKFLKDSKEDLIEVAGNILLEDIGYLSDIMPQWAVQRIIEMFDEYKDYEIKVPAKEADILRNPHRIFDGTLARFDNWGRKEYRWSITQPDDISLNPANKRWMHDHLKIDDPKMRLYVQEFMDDLVLYGVLENFKEDATFRLKGWEKVY